MKRRLLYAVLCGWFAVSGAQAGGEIYGTIFLEDGRSLTGPIRWDRNENFWPDVLNGTKMDPVEPAPAPAPVPVLGSPNPNKPQMPDGPLDESEIGVDVPTPAPAPTPAPRTPWVGRHRRSCIHGSGPGPARLWRRHAAGSPGK